MSFGYKILFGGMYLLSLLPLRLLYVISELLFYPLFYCVRYRRRVVRKNLKESFPEKDAKEIKHIEKKFYHFLCDYFVETVKLFSISHKEIRRRMQFIGLDQLHADMERSGNKFCLLYLGHYCNWEYVASLSLWIPEMHAGQIYHLIYNQAFNEKFLELRNQFGGESILMKNTLRRILELKNQPKKVMIGFIADQAPKMENMHHWTTFLNHDTSFFIGTERIGKQIDAAIYYLRVERVKRGYYRATFELMTLNPKEFPDYELTDIYASKLEEQIKQEPAYWLWTHKRWKRTKEQWMKWNKRV